MLLQNKSNITNSDEQHPSHMVNFGLWPTMTWVSLLCLILGIFNFFFFDVSRVFSYLTSVTQAGADNAWAISTYVNFYWLEHAGLNELYLQVLCFFWGGLFAFVMSFSHNKLHTCSSIFLMVLFWCFSAFLGCDSLFYIFFLEVAGGFSFFGILNLNSNIFNTWSGGEDWTDFFSHLQCPWFFCRVLFGILLVQHCFIASHVYLFIFFLCFTTVNFLSCNLGIQSSCVQSEVSYLLSTCAQPLLLMLSVVSVILYSFFCVSGSLFLDTGNAFLVVISPPFFFYYIFSFHNSVWAYIVKGTLHEHILTIGFFTLYSCLTFVSLDNIHLVIWIVLTILLFFCVLYSYNILFKSWFDSLVGFTGTDNELGVVVGESLIWSNILIFSLNIMAALVFLGVLKDVLLNCLGVGDIIHVYQISHNHMENLFWDLYSGNINSSEYDLKIMGAAPPIPIKSSQDVAYNYILLGLELFCYLQVVLVLMDLN